MGAENIMDNLSIVLKALADETRFKIINILITHNYCVGALAHHLGISKAAVSQHLQILRKAGLVKGEKSSYWTHYSVEKEVLILVAEALKRITTQPVNHEHICHQHLKNTDVTERRGTKMCNCNCSCERPEKLKESPGKCTPEQIKECHGDVQDHPCESKTE